MELPIYTIKSNTIRILIPKAIKLLGLAVLLYIGVIFLLFTMKKSIPSYINYLIIAIIFVLVLIEALLTYNKTIKNSTPISYTISDYKELALMIELL